MEWAMTINQMLRNDITKLDHTLLPAGFHGDVHSVRAMQSSLAKVIDALGVQSAAAQGLNKVITSAEKLRTSPAHILYLLKDSNAKDGNGEAVGMLKVGRKHLYLFDTSQRHHEVEALCVLDFYVSQGRQRCGFGRMLFDYMLQDLNMSPSKMAVDGPSAKMEQFLRKNYGMEQLLHQHNNFAVSPRFFEHCATTSPGRGSPSAAPLTPGRPLVGRYAAPQPPCFVAAVIHGGAGHAPDGADKAFSRRAAHWQ